MESMKELSLSEMEGISGGSGGYSYRPRRQDGFCIYQIQRGDTLAGIAQKHGTTESYLKSINRTITNVRDITPGFYIYVPE